MLADSVETLSASMAVMVTYWLSYEYVRDPRRAMEPESAGVALSRGARHVLALLSPYLSNAELRTHLSALTDAYSEPAA
jgi:Bacterial transcriptional repressor